MAQGGRPSINADIKKMATITIKVSYQEKASILQQAQSRGMKASAYLRERGLNHKVPAPIHPEQVRLLQTLGALRQELNDIGHNINQIAKNWNAGETPINTTLSAMTSLQAKLTELGSTIANEN